MSDLSDMNVDDGVPARYRGIWRRSLLATPEMRDTTTTVYWMQAPNWHADIRIPAGRPDFSGVASLDACSAAQRAWLATQQGFAGITRVTRDLAGEVCTWQRRIDLQPPQPAPDEGWMRFEPDRLVETGKHASYLEHWHRLPGTSERMAVLRADGGDPARAAEMLFLAGGYAMHLRLAHGGAGPVIAFCRRTADGYLILHATEPWLEGRHYPLLWEGDGREWQVLESIGPDWRDATVA
jgi:hypothetical protein